jgi:hypothetical protein
MLMVPESRQSSSGLCAKKYFAELDSFGSDVPTNNDPVGEWLLSPPIPSVKNPIIWWTDMYTAGHPLAQMALDFLSAPGVSCFILNNISY